MPENKAPEAASEKKKAELDDSAKKAIRYGIALILFLILTNPSLLFFLPEGAKSSLKRIWHGLFGNVDKVKDAISINFVSIFQIMP